MLPKNLFEKYLDRFDELISQGEEFKAKLQELTRKGKDAEKDSDFYYPYCQWWMKTESLLETIIPLDSTHRKIIDRGKSGYYGYVNYSLDSRVSELISLKELFERGFLGNLSLQIEAEISADYMGQAEQLLKEGQTGKYDHVPAAVLCGAVLEKALRTLCDQQNPPIPTLKNDGTPKTLNPLIDDLKKAGLFNELKAKHLRAWADIRNKAAHGNFDQFSRSDVEMMIKGVEDFLANYMT